MTMSFPVACFAPPLTDELLGRYRELVDGLDPSETKEALASLLACVAAWWALPESTRTDGRRLALQVPVKDAAGQVVYDERGAPVREARTIVERPLEADHVQALFDVTPWMRELNTLSTPAGDGLLDALPPGELRNAAFHLLWHVKEITLDREPLTQDCLPV